MKQEELDEILRKHKLWLDNKPDGKRADLIDANLSRANLTDANLSGANLYRANLSDANLYRANLSDANLSDANLYRANLSDANLTYANLAYANLTSVISNKVFIAVYGIGSEGRQTLYNATDDQVFCGCFNGTMAEFEAKVRETHKGNKEHLTCYLAAIKFLKASAKAKLKK